MTPGRIIPAVALILIGLLALFGQGNFLSVMAILFGLLFLVRQFDNNNVTVSWTPTTDRRRASFEDFEDEEAYEADSLFSRFSRLLLLPVESEPLSFPWARSSEPVYSQALRAVRRTGLDPNKISVLPVDIGFLAFVGEKQRIYRGNLPDDVDYIQPFVQLRLTSAATGRVRFEIVDGAGETIFIHEDNHHLERGRTLISPSARLPIHDQQAMDGVWKLQIMADDVPLAIHEFNFTEFSATTQRTPVGEDGELTQELRVAMAKNKLQRMSMDELLSTQEEDEAPLRQRK